MIKYIAKKEKSGEAEITKTIKVKKEEIKKAVKQALENLRKNLVVPGFRKGKVPEDVAKKHISDEKLIEETARIVFSDIYLDLIKKEDLKPFSEPIIEDLDIGLNKDWSFKIIIILEPEVQLPDYKKIVTEVKGSTKKDEIWVPGKEQTKEDTQKKEKLLNQILDKLLEKTKIKISPTFVKKEVKKRLVDLIDDVRKAGMKFDEYLKTKGLTAEKIQERFENELITTYKLELALLKIADQENITVDEEEVKKLLKIDTPEKEQQMKGMLYYYAAAIRKQKTLEFLLSI